MFNLIIYLFSIDIKIKSKTENQEDGKYDYAPFLEALKEAEFKGPVGYINFKFDKEPDDYLPRSMEEWKRLKNNYLNY